MGTGARLPARASSISARTAYGDFEVMESIVAYAPWDRMGAAGRIVPPLLLMVVISTTWL